MEKNYALMDWLLRAEKCIGTPKKATQSREFETLRLSKALIKEFESNGFPKDSLRSLKALEKLAVATTDFNLIIRYAKILFEYTRKDFYYATESLARALLHRGEVEAALKHLEYVADDKLTPGALQRKIRARNAIDLGAVSPITDKILNGRPKVAVTAAKTQQLINHVDERLVDGIETLFQSVGISPTGKRGKVAPDIPRVVIAPMNLIFCGGFKWSGASAVRDYFVDFETVASPPAEMRMFTDPDFSVRDLYQSFEENDATALLRNARGLVLEKILGICLDNPTPRRVQYRLAAALVTLDRRRKNSQICPSAAYFFREVLSTKGPFPKEAFQDWINATARAICLPGSEVCVFDSVLRAPDRDLMPLMQHAKMFAVFRDPRDMYMTHVIRGNWTAGIETYIDELKAMLAMHENGADDRTTKVQYERFILSSQYRADIGRVGLGDNPTKGPKPKFDPRDSSTNIGIHRKFEDKEALARLEDAFPDLCIEDPVALWKDT